MRYSSSAAGMSGSSQVPLEGDWGDWPGDEAGRPPEVTEAEEELWRSGDVDDFFDLRQFFPELSGPAARPR